MTPCPLRFLHVERLYYGTVLGCQHCQTLASKVCHFTVSLIGCVPSRDALQSGGAFVLARSTWRSWKVLDILEHCPPEFLLL